MNGIGRRLTDFRNMLGFRSQQAFAEHLGVKRSTLASYENETYPPSAEFLTILHDRDHVNINWVLTGVGEMGNGFSFHGKGGTDTVSFPPSDEPKGSIIPDRGSAVVQRQPDLALIPVLPVGDGDESLALAKRWGYPDDVIVYKYRKGHAEPLPIQAPDPSGTVFVPVFSQAVDAGPGQEATQLVETEETAPVLYALCQGHHPESCGLCRVIGDSMTDVTLFNGDWVVFDRTDIKGDGIFVISMFGEMRVKRLQYRLADRKIMIASENSKRYPEPEIVNADVIERGELRIYGRVLGWLHRHPY